VTILGAVCDRDTITMWADDLVTLAGKPAHHRPKLAVNTSAGVIGVGCGWLSLTEVGATAVIGGADLDTIVPAVMYALRKASSTVISRMPDEQRFRFGAGTYVLGGWSSMAGRMLVYELAAFAFWEPRLATAALSPRLEEGTPWRPPTTRNVGGIAARQAEALALGGGHAGRLTIATITRQGIGILPPEDIAPLPSGAEGDGATPALREGSSEAGEAIPFIHLAA
jgi:hypothetical protein